jgi:hypothetical protein
VYVPSREPEAVPLLHDSLQRSRGRYVGVVFFLHCLQSLFSSRSVAAVQVQSVQDALEMVRKGMRGAAVDRCGCRGATLQVLEFQRQEESDSLLNDLLLIVAVLLDPGAAALSETISIPWLGRRSERKIASGDCILVLMRRRVDVV